jgi:hypothetical protein
MAITQQELQFVQGVSSQTGIDPRVLITWIAGEGHPGDFYNNYLNIAAPTASSLGVPVSGVAPANTAEFADLQTGIDATVKEIKSLGLTSLAHQTPRQEISQIAASPWASSHYGGPGGPNLVRSFEGLFPGKIDAPWSPPTATGMAGNQVGIQVGGIGGPTVVSGAVGAVGGAASGAVGAVTGAIDAIDSIPKFLNFITSWRFVEIIGGFFLLIVGLILLGRQYGMSVPTPPAAGKAASGVDSVFAFEPGEQAYRAGQASRRVSREGTGPPRKTRRVMLDADRPAPRRAASAAAASDEIPF